MVANKKALSPEAQKEGRNSIYIILGMIALGLAIAFYNMHMV